MSCILSRTNNNRVLLGFVTSAIETFHVKIIDHVGTNGLSPFLKDFVDNMNDEEYSIWLHYSLKGCIGM